MVLLGSKKQQIFKCFTLSELMYRLFRVWPYFVQHTEFFLDKVRWSSSLTFHQLRGKGHRVTTLATNPYNGVDLEGTFRKYFRKGILWHNLFKNVEATNKQFIITGIIKDSYHYRKVTRSRWVENSNEGGGKKILEGEKELNLLTCHARKVINWISRQVKEWSSRLFEFCWGGFFWFYIMSKCKIYTTDRTVLEDAGDDRPLIKILLPLLHNNQYFQIHAIKDESCRLFWYLERS